MYLKLFLIALPTFLIIDIIWLSLVAKNLYKEHLGFIMGSSVNWYAAGLFYLLFIAGLVFFVIEPAVTKGSYLYALLAGAFFGLITYATYDLTNLATLKDWPIQITIIDLIWGSFVSLSVAVIAYGIAKKIGLARVS